MNKLIVMMMLAMVMVGCAEKIEEVVGLRFGDSPAEVKKSAEKHNYEITKDLEDYIKFEGNAKYVDMQWDNISCEFNDGKLTEITLFSRQLPDKGCLEDMNKHMKSMCGASRVVENEDFFEVYFGSKDENEGYLGNLTFIFDRPYGNKTTLSIYCVKE